MVFDKCFIFKVKMQRSQLIRRLLVFCFTVQTLAAEAPAAPTGVVLRGVPGGPAAPGAPGGPAAPGAPTVLGAPGALGALGAPRAPVQ